MHTYIYFFYNCAQRPRTLKFAVGHEKSSSVTQRDGCVWPFLGWTGCDGCARSPLSDDHSEPMLFCRKQWRLGCPRPHVLQARGFLDEGLHVSEALACVARSPGLLGKGRAGVPPRRCVRGPGSPKAGLSRERRTHLSSGEQAGSAQPRVRQGGRR